MKKHVAALLVLSLVPVAACDQPKSGPVKPEADEPIHTTAMPEPVARHDLFATQGPAAPVKIGTPTAVELSVTPGDGFKINKRFEWSFEFHPNAQVDLAQPSINMDGLTLDDQKATIPINVTAKSGGDHTLTATGNFSVCNDDKCELYRDREVTFTMAATDG